MKKFLNLLNPFRETVNSAAGTIDKLVLDKDLALELKTQVRVIELKGEELALALERTEIELDAALAQAKEQSHQMALQSKTIPWVDALHKMARTLLALLNMLINAGVILYLARIGVEINAETMAILGAGGVAAGTYIYKKGKGAEIK